MFVVKILGCVQLKACEGIRDQDQRLNILKDV